MVDHAEVKKTLAKEMSILDAGSVEKWNFDFASGKPLSGKYDWEEPDENVPSAYNMEHLDLKMLSAYSSFACSVEKSVRSKDTEDTERVSSPTPIKSELFTFTPSKDSRLRTPRARLARRRSTAPSPRPIRTEAERVSGKRKQSQITGKNWEYISYFLHTHM